MARLPLPRAESCKPLQIASAGFAGSGEPVTTLVYRSPASSGADDNADEVGMFHLHHEEEHLRLCRGPRQLQRLRVQRHHLRQQAAGERAAARADAPADKQHSTQNVHTHFGCWSALGPHCRCQFTLAAGGSHLWSGSAFPTAHNARRTCSWPARLSIAHVRELATAPCRRGTSSSCSACQSAGTATQQRRDSPAASAAGERMTQMPSRQRRHAKPDSVRARLAGFRAGWHHGSGAHWVPDSSRRLCCSADMVGRATLLLPVRSSGAAASAVAASISPRRSFSFS